LKEVEDLLVRRNGAGEIHYNEHGAQRGWCFVLKSPAL
jgi:hypothetical protein